MTIKSGGVAQLRVPMLEGHTIVFIEPSGAKEEVSPFTFVQTFRAVARRTSDGVLVEGSIKIHYTTSKNILTRLRRWWCERRGIEWGPDLRIELPGGRV